MIYERDENIQKISNNYNLLVELYKEYVGCFEKEIVGASDTFNVGKPKA